MIYICKWLLVCVMGNKGLLCSVTPIPRKKQQLNYYFRFLIRFVSVAMQTRVSPVSADFGTTAHLQDSLLTSTPIKGPGWRPSKRPRLELEEEEESDSSNESHKDPLDSTYNPGDSVLTEETDVS